MLVAECRQRRGMIERDGVTVQPDPGAMDRSRVCVFGPIADELRKLLYAQIVGLRHDGQLYRFATYTGAAIERLELEDTHVTWHMSGRAAPIARPPPGNRRLAGRRWAAAFA